LLTEHLLQLKQKNYWLADTITLNQSRKSQITKQQQDIDYQAVLNNFRLKRDKLNQALARAKNIKNGQAFADKDQQLWLSRINNSQQSLELLEGKRDITDYQERLDRVAGVLAWQLKQSYVERLWQHQKQLNAIDNSLLKVNKQLVSFEALAKSDARLVNVTQRQTQASNEINALLASVDLLRINTDKNIRNKVLSFINSQKDLLNEHLLDTRRATADVLEKIAVKDRKIEQQLTPDIQTSGDIL